MVTYDNLKGLLDHKHYGSDIVDITSYIGQPLGIFTTAYPVAPSVGRYDFAGTDGDNVNGTVYNNGDSAFWDGSVWTRIPKQVINIEQVRSQSTNLAPSSKLMDDELSKLVAKTGDQTITGVKTFSSSPVIPSATNNTEAQNKAGVETQITARQENIRSQSTTKSPTSKLMDDLLKANPTFKGIATPSTTPGTPDHDIYYFATQPGVYSNFGGHTISTEGLYLLRYQDSIWYLNTLFVNTFLGSSEALNLRRQTQFQIFNQNDGTGDISVSFNPTTGDATITMTGDLLFHTSYKDSGTTAYTRLVRYGGTRTIVVPTGKSLYMDIAAAIGNASASAIPDSAFTMSAGVANASMVDFYPTDKVLMFSNWGKDFKGASGLIKDYLTGKYAYLAESSVDVDYVLKRREETQFQILINPGGSINVVYDVSGNATINLIGDLILYSAYKVPTSPLAYTRLVTAGNTKTISLPKGNSLYLDIPTALSNGFSSAMPEIAFTQIGALDKYPENKVLLLSNWAEGLKGASGLISDYIVRQSIADSNLDEIKIIAMDAARSKAKIPVNYGKIHDRIKPFVKNYLNQSKDLEIVLLGDSILGRTINNTAYSTAIQQSRPPMMISKNIASGVWDKINPGNITHSRWDKPGIFTESGSGWTSYFGEALKAAWDDAGDRAGETREFLGTAAASVAFSFLANNRRLNFIYRTSTEGSNSLSVSVSAGIGKLEVYNGSEWVEAHGYTFSQLYTASGSGYGNTEYQRRLKFRKVTAETSNAHTITISKAVTGTSQSLMYWGTEQTNRDIIISVRNVARGGHDMQTLWNTIRTEFDNFDTDLVLFEIPILNMKASGTYTPDYLWTSTIRGVYTKLLSADANSLKTLSGSFLNWQVVPMLINETLAWINTDGTLKDFPVSGVNYNSDSFFNYISSKFWDNDNEIGFINIWRWLKENSIETFGDLYTSMINTTKESRSSYAYNGHPNDYCVENILNYLLPIFDFNIS